MIRASIGAFFKTLCVMIGIGAGFMILSIGSSFLPISIEPYIQTTTVAYGGGQLTGPLIARINIHGVIGMGDLRIEKVQAQLDATQDGIYHGRTKALLLHINSPGGGAVDSNDIYNALIAYKKKYNIPIYVYADGLCASGGMMIASAADKILASPTTLTGSVGVILSPFFNVTGLMEKVGVTSKSIKEGKFKDELNPFRPWTPNEGEQMERITRAMYDVFVDVVATGRPKLTRDKLQELGASLFMSPRALEMGYIDGITSTLSDALMTFTKESSLPENTAVIGPAIRHSFIDMLTAKQAQGSIQVEHKLHGLSTVPEELQGQACYLYLPGATQ